MTDLSPTNHRDWDQFRQDLLQVAVEGDHDWLDEKEIRSVLNESSRTGLRPELLISCRAALEGRGPRDRIVSDNSAKKRILIIDDEHANCVIISNALEKSGFAVGVEEQSENYRQAIDAFRPDLLLLDMVMPEVDGLDILKALGEDEATRQLPVIVLTGLIADSATASVNRAGLLFLAKPLSPRTLVHCISQHLEAQ